MIKLTISTYFSGNKLEVKVSNNHLTLFLVSAKNVPEKVGQKTVKMAKNGQIFACVIYGWYLILFDPTFER